MKPPAFQFYPKQWLGDDKVMLMDWDAKGMHFQLICIAWQREQPCTLPNDENLLRRWVGQPSDDVWQRVWPQIKQAWELGRGGMYVQRGLLAVYLKQLAYKKERSSSGKMGAERRWHSHGSAIKEPLAKNGFTSSSSPSSASTEKNPPISPPSPRPSRKPKGAAIEFWKELVEHINAGWMMRKKAAYPWDDYEFKKLRSLAKIYQAHGVMALWDVYMQIETYFGKLTGYMLDGLKKDVGVIVDQPQWKPLAAKYEKQLYDAAFGPPKDINSIVGDLVGSVKTIPKIRGF